MLYVSTFYRYARIFSLMKAIIVHGWMCWPDHAWYPWLRKELESRGYEVQVPLLPNPELPDRETWVHIIRDLICDPDTLIVAHSMGCPTTLFALQEYNGPPIHQMICVSGFGRPYTLPLLKHWFGESKLDFEKIKTRVKHWAFLHSTNDPLVPYAEGEWLAQQLGGSVVAIRKGHLIQEEGVFELPEVLDLISK